MNDPTERNAGWRSAPQRRLHRDAEVEAADYIKREFSKSRKPVVGFIGGATAPPGKRMGHAGAIITGSSGTAEGKAKALEEKGIRVGRTPTEVGELVQKIL